ncbi:hypothetical protein MMC14_010337 [Varicellaria rhodocarpa]|nr:hypothetical protein [Varicellaria rhodocarpa]
MTAGLTYSGTAAIHACFLLWRGSAWGELDVLGLYATLSSSCLVVVPLLNWSSTLRNLGRIGLRREPTRAIILYWGFLVALGYLSIFIQFGGQGKTIEWGMYTWSGLENITCTPRGNLNLSAGQVPSWTDLILDQEFITENRCENPCSTSFSPNPPFRTDNDLQIPTKKEREFLDSWYYRIQFEHSPARHDVPHLLYFHYITFGVWSIVTVLAQGTYAASFGRRTPTEARYMLYKKLRPRLCGIKTSKSVAMFAYFWALAVLVLCPMVFVVNLVTIEMFLSNFPESDPLIHVGAWSSWAATGLVISAALISRYHEDAVKASQRFKTHATSRIRCCFEALRLCKAPYRQRNVYLGESKDLEESSPSSHNARSLMIYHLIKLITHQVLRKALEILTFLQKEYRMSVAFWRDPETTPLQTSGQEAQASVLNLPQNIHVNTNISSTSDPPISFSRSTTFNFSRASTSETLVQHPSKPEANDSKKGHDRFEIEEILSSSAGSLSTLTPPVPMVPERVLGKDRERKSSHRK